MSPPKPFAQLESLEDWLAFCGCPRWASAMLVDARDSEDVAAVHRTADAVFDTLQRPDWLEAFAAHPPIGDIESMRMKFAGNRRWSRGEQSGIDDAGDAVLQELAAANAEYKQRFGFLFIVFATGKTAAEMLSLLRSRLDNRPEDEWKVAAEQQRLITHHRIDKFVTERASAEAEGD